MEGQENHEHVNKYGKHKLSFSLWSGEESQISVTHLLHVIRQWELGKEYMQIGQGIWYTVGRTH